MWPKFYNKIVHAGATQALENHWGRKDLHKHETLNTDCTIWFFTKVNHSNGKTFGIVNFIGNITMEECPKPAGI